MAGPGDATKFRLAGHAMNGNFVMNDWESLTRRDFLRGTTAATWLMVLGAEAEGAPAPAAAAPAAPVRCGVIGTGIQGRALLSVLARMPAAPVVAVCDSYEVALKAAQPIAPQAKPYADYRQMLTTEKSLDAVFIATPSHLHREPALAAVQAGKHVYCEAPLATTVEDARAIAAVGKGATGSGPARTFQVGLQQRANPLYKHAVKFVRTGALNNIVQARAQWHRKQSWRRAARDPKIERQLNWRLFKESSLGLVGEVGVHQLDVASWFLKKLPLSVVGFGATLQWQDGREVPDTVQCLVEYPGGLRLSYDATLVNSYDSSYELFMGSDGAILTREDRSWLFKEADAPQLGWEVYARKDKIGDETGIALVADATKLLAQGKTPAQAAAAAGASGKNALYYAVEDFLGCAREAKKPSCGPLEGMQAAVVAIKAHEAIMAGSKVTIQKEWLELA
jgi:predicted dehydrogenase